MSATGSRICPTSVDGLRLRVAYARRGVLMSSVAREMSNAAQVTYRDSFAVNRRDVEPWSVEMSQILFDNVTELVDTRSRPYRHWKRLRSPETARYEHELREKVNELARLEGKPITNDLEESYRMVPGIPHAFGMRSWLDDIPPVEHILGGMLKFPNMVTNVSLRVFVGKKPPRDVALRVAAVAGGALQTKITRSVSAVHARATVSAEFDAEVLANTADIMTHAHSVDPQESVKSFRFACELIRSVVPSGILLDDTDARALAGVFGDPNADVARDIREWTESRERYSRTIHAYPYTGTLSDEQIWYAARSVGECRYTAQELSDFMRDTYPVVQKFSDDDGSPYMDIVGNLLSDKETTILRSLGRR